MNRIFITGDVHGNIDFDKLNVFNTRMGNDLDKSDVIVIAGDWGLIWDTNPDAYMEVRLKTTIEEHSCSYFVIFGNHENYDRINNLPIKIAYGNLVRYELEFPSIVYAINGNVYNINGKKMFAFGGADSIDKHHRTEGVSWWRDEIPNDEMKENGLNQLYQNCNQVDFVVTHTAPYSFILELNSLKLASTDYNWELEYYFDDIAQMEVGTWYFGHYHRDQNAIDGRWQCLYQDFVEIT